MNSLLGFCIEPPEYSIHDSYIPFGMLQGKGRDLYSAKPACNPIHHKPNPKPKKALQVQGFFYLERGKGIEPSS